MMNDYLINLKIWHMRKCNITSLSVRSTNKKVNARDAFLEIAKVLTGKRNPAKVIRNGIITVAVFYYLSGLADQLRIVIDALALMISLY